MIHVVHSGVVEFDFLAADEHLQTGQYAFEYLAEHRLDRRGPDAAGPDRARQQPSTSFCDNTNARSATTLVSV